MIFTLLSLTHSPCLPRSTKWTNKKDLGESGCQALIQSMPGECNQEYFVYAYGGDKNCGCIDQDMKDADCSLKKNQERQRKVTESARAHNSYSARRTAALHLQYYFFNFCCTRVSY